MMHTIHTGGTARHGGSLPPSLSSVAALMLAGHPSRYLLVSIVILLLWPQYTWAAQQMLLHVVTMTALAPALALLLLSASSRQPEASPRLLWAATAVQSVVFLFWHAPAGMTAAMHEFGVALLLQASLLLAACLFWYSLLHLHADKTWHAILALLLTGKLFCLVALLLSFAPRALYPAMTLADQQLAGMIMITLCPLCYVASAVWLCARWLAAIEQHDGRRGGEHACT